MDKELFELLLNHGVALLILILVLGGAFVIAKYAAVRVFDAKEGLLAKAIRDNRDAYARVADQSDQQIALCHEHGDLLKSLTAKFDDAARFSTQETEQALRDIARVILILVKSIGIIDTATRDRVNQLLTKVIERLKLKHAHCDADDSDENYLL